MPIDKAEIERRTEVARAAIKAAYGTEDDEYGVMLFVSHHLEVMEPDYWEERFQTISPEPARILDALVMCSDFGDVDEEDDDLLGQLDFTLPGDVTDYVICVSFDEAGEVDEICMES